MSSPNSISYYDYPLPDELIARAPADRRDGSRLMVIDRKTARIQHRMFAELPELLQARDLLVMNNTRVVPARLNGIRTATGGKWEGLFLREEADGRWRLIGQTRGSLKAGESLTLTLPAPDDQHPSSSTPHPSAGTVPEKEPAVELQLEERCAGGEWIVRPQSNEPLLTLLEKFGTLPLPHYIQRDTTASDWERYQTTYAERPGAVAAPTAGLHFTPELIRNCEARGVETTRVTLHVGLGTFRPVSAENLDEHRMHFEWCEMSEQAAGTIQAARQSDRRIIAVGTTSVRTVESIALRGPLQAWRGETDLFIRPPFQFQIFDGLITNFHLPRSTLMVLVCTFAGRDLMMQAYEEAIRERYRFFSYGDAMLIL